MFPVDATEIDDSLKKCISRMYMYACMHTYVYMHRRKAGMHQTRYTQACTYWPNTFSWHVVRIFMCACRYTCIY